jgi:hypothetical protein
MCTGAVGLFGMTAFAADGVTPTAAAPAGAASNPAISTSAFAGQRPSSMVKPGKVDQLELIRQAVRAKQGPGGPGTRGECANAQPGDIEEGEPSGGCATDYIDTFNAGCNSAPASFSEIACGQTIHGLSGTFLNGGLQYRDTDWYLISTTGGTRFTVTCIADFDSLFGMVDPLACAFIGTPGFGSVCSSASITSACLPAGDYVVFVAPSVFDGVGCGVNYRVTLTCEACEPPPPPPNDNCANAIPVNCNSTVSGDTTNATTDLAWPCAAGGSEIWYSFVAADPVVNLDLCASGYDTAVAVTDGCGGTVLGCNDDSCGLQSQLSVSGLTVGATYRIAVGGFAAGTGPFSMSITCGIPPSCNEPQPGDIEEGEPFGGCATDYIDTFNAGCNSAPASFSEIDCGDTVHGLSGTFLNGGLQYRDTDWYLISTTGGTIFTVTCNADFNSLFGMVDPFACAFIGSVGFGAPCIPTSVTSECLPAGDYVVFVAPSGFSGVPCGVQYRVSLSCETCVPPPPPANNDCANAQLIDCGQTVNGSNENATTDGFAPCGAAGADVWYKWIAANSSATLSTCGSPLDTVLAVYDGCGGNNLICLDDFCGLQTEITVGGLTVGNTYWVSVSGFAAQEGTFSLTLSNCGPTGACCVAGDCSVMTPGACAAAGGSYQGDGSDCGGQNYVVSRHNVAMEDISASGTPGCAGDDCSSLVGLGFTFTYYGADFTDINVGSNGHMRFGGPATVFGNPASLPTADSYDNIVAPYWDDWRTDAVCAGATIDTQTLGSAPNRRFIAQWTNVCHFSNNAQHATFQAILYEASGNIEFRYGTPLDLNSPVVGIENANGTDGENVTPIPVSGESVMIAAEETGNPCGCECAGDVDGNGVVNLADLAFLLSAFGSSGPFANPCVDIDGNGVVNLADLAFLLSAFGSTCP